MVVSYFFKIFCIFFSCLSGRHELHLGCKWAGIRRYRYPRTATERLRDDFLSCRCLLSEADLNDSKGEEHGSGSWLLKWNAKIVYA